MTLRNAVTDLYPNSLEGGVTRSKSMSNVSHVRLPGSMIDHSGCFLWRGYSGPRLVRAVFNHRCFHGDHK
jgi:hypothetical protein